MDLWNYLSADGDINKYLLLLKRYKYMHSTGLKDHAPDSNATLYRRLSRHTKAHIRDM